MPEATPLQVASEAFIRYLRDVRQLSPHTVSNYQRDLAGLQRFCADRGRSDPARLHESDIRAWVSQLRRQGLASSSIQRALSALRSFFNYLGREQGHTRNPAAAVQAPRQPRRLPRALDTDQVNRYLQFSGDDLTARRDSAMAELFYSSGLRLAELAAINLGDIDRHEQLLTVTGKGRKTRTVPVGAVALAALDRWLEVRPASTDPALFLSRRGTRASARTIQDRLRLQGRRAGMYQDVHPHMLRHSFASHMLESSGDLRAVQELLGHANIATTQIYTHLDFQHLAKVYDAAHPRARRRKPGEE
ncbi:MAG: tyrosine recombinase XerC [Haliea sp.]|uniref:tyrosine recombinase XerC n=1 Tax=Haliea sp. TaxID=1932666 RepID=UPI000C5ABAF3|nr:tyrosine recombinase XerC [Haliea sp.]MBM69596.1 tyrosine recombinase XerC [Haliea sp.]|tara:strand:+ start:1548 stop:2459 length:912 start_codon:yes stop_codon:yes gene_type:complete